MSFAACLVTPADGNADFAAADTLPPGDFWLADTGYVVGKDAAGLCGGHEPEPPARRPAAADGRPVPRAPKGFPPEICRVAARSSPSS